MALPLLPAQLTQIHADLGINADVARLRKLVSESASILKSALICVSFWFLASSRQLLLPQFPYNHLGQTQALADFLVDDGRVFDLFAVQTIRGDYRALANLIGDAKSLRQDLRTIISKKSAFGIRPKP